LESDSNEDNVPKDRRLIKNKYFSKVKKNGGFYAWIEACNNSHVPGVNFTGCLDPIIKDVFFRILLLKSSFEILSLKS
jgi:hypothetical protein